MREKHRRSDVTGHSLYSGKKQVRMSLRTTDIQNQEKRGRDKKKRKSGDGQFQSQFACLCQLALSLHHCGRVLGCI